LRYAPPGESNVKRTHKEYIIILMRLINAIPDDEIDKKLRDELLNFLDKLQTCLTRKTKKQREYREKLPRLLQYQEDIRNALIGCLDDQWRNSKELMNEAYELIKEDIPSEYYTTGRVTYILGALCTDGIAEKHIYKDENGHDRNYYRLAQEEEETE